MIMQDGFATIVTFSLQPNIKVYETEVTPPSPDTGEPIPQDTMRSVKWGMKAFQKLLDMTDGSVVFAFDATALNPLIGMMGKNQQITILLPDTFTIRFWGGIRNGKFSSFVKGVRPTVTCDVVCTNQDDAGNESGPLYQYLIGG